MSSDVAKCKASVWKPDRTFRGGRSVQCTRAAKVDGYCTQHHPDTIKARDLKLRQEYDAKWAAESARRRLNEAAPDLLAALKRIVAEVDRPQTGTPVVGGVLRAIAESREAIAKAEGKS